MSVVADCDLRRGRQGLRQFYRDLRRVGVPGICDQFGKRRRRLLVHLYAEGIDEPAVEIEVEFGLVIHGSMIAGAATFHIVHCSGIRIRWG